MTLREKLDKIKESEIFKLVYNGKVLGLRVKSFNVVTDKFDYYDFELSIITNQNVINFIRSIKDMKSVELIRTGNGLLISESEQKQGVVVGEFEDESDAIRVLQQFIRIYEYKK